VPRILDILRACDRWDCAHRHGTSVPTR
jgi:hypothetical protein